MTNQFRMTLGPNVDVYHYPISTSPTPDCDGDSDKVLHIERMIFRKLKHEI
jgi:hypothetical protein